MIESTSISKNPIVIIGSGNEECIIQLDTEFQCDQKYLTEYLYLVGGSGVNCTLRLINTGYKVIPILPLGRDAIGQKIRSLITLENLCKDSDKIKLFINSDHFFIKNVKTAKATIIVDKKGHRTVFTERNQSSCFFADHVDTCIRFFRQETIPENQIKSIIIGHIQADHPNNNPENPGAITKHLIKFFQGCHIFTNLGHSQIYMGIRFWESYLKQVTIFQLNVSEIRNLFRINGYNDNLYEIVTWLYKKRITTVITMNQAGAIGIFNRNEKGIIYSPGYHIENFVDSTGAGDAFMAGIVSRLHNKSDFGIEELTNAIERGQIWATYACTKLGASQACPNQEEIEKYESEIRENHPAPTQVLSIDDAKKYINSMLKYTD